MFRISVVLLLVCFVAPVPSMGQSAEADTSSVMEAGVWALQFRVLGNFTLGPFQGGGISAKYHTDARRAWRVGIELDGELSDTDSEDVFSTSQTSSGNPGSSSQNMNVESSDVTNFEAAIDAQRIWYAKESRDIFLYWGVGPRLSFRDRFAEAFQTEVDPQPPTLQSDLLTEQSLQQFGIGVTGVVGGEWFASKHISFSAEYAPVVEYLFEEQDSGSRRFTISEVNGVRTERTTTTTRRADSNRLLFRSFTVRFGLTLYL